MRYDAAIIGAGTNGLAAASALAGAGLKTIVLERALAPGGRCTTREFHPGFRASPYCDEIAPIPHGIFRALDLARHGAIFTSAPSDLFRLTRFPEAAPERRWWDTAQRPQPWQGEELSHRALAEVVDDTACFLAGRSADPDLPGSALHLLCRPGGSGMTMGGLGRLGEALAGSAQAAGAEISLGLEVADIRLAKRRAAGVRLADGTEIEARAVISTLDLRRTFFSLFAWKDLPGEVVERVSRWRQAAAAARLLIALDAKPGDVPAYIAADPAEAHAAWRAGTVPEHPPIALKLVSAEDPRLAPIGQAVLTATVGAIPHHLFDGAWTHEKREALKERVLTVLPGLKEHVLAVELIVPPDIEEQLGISEGDLDGGEIAPDQMFEQRGFGPHTPVDGLFLGSRSSPLGPFASCAAGWAAAHAVMADLA